MKCSAGLSDIVYHFTSITAATNILTENVIKLTFISGADDVNKPDKKYYYLSTTRSRVGSYHTGHYVGVLLKLNGRKLRDNYVGGPVDYWGPEFRKVAPSKNEMEDRLWSDKPFIKDAIKYIDEVHVYFDNKVGIEDYDKRQIRKLLIEAKKKGIPTFVYPTQKAANLLDKRKAIPLSKIDLKTRKPINYGLSLKRGDWLASWLELYEKDKKEYLSEKAIRDIRRLYAIDGMSSFFADVHNQKKGSPALHKIVEILKKEDWTITDFYKHLQKKWLG